MHLQILIVRLLLMMMMMLSVSQTHTLRTNRKKIDWLEIKATYKLLKDNTTT